MKALKLRDGDELINVLRTSGEDEVIIGTHLGYSVRFKGAIVRDMGRAAAGVKGLTSEKVTLLLELQELMTIKKSLLSQKMVLVNELKLRNIQQKAVVVKG